MYFCSAISLTCKFVNSTLIKKKKNLNSDGGLSIRRLDYITSATNTVKSVLTEP
jgi:hypothetical protein